MPVGECRMVLAPEIMTGMPAAWMGEGDVIPAACRPPSTLSSQRYPAKFSSADCAASADAQPAVPASAAVSSGAAELPGGLRPRGACDPGKKRSRSDWRVGAASAAEVARKPATGARRARVPRTFSVSRSHMSSSSASSAASALVLAYSSLLPRPHTLPPADGGRGRAEGGADSTRCINALARATLSSSTSLSPPAVALSLGAAFLSLSHP